MLFILLVCHRIRPSAISFSSTWEQNCSSISRNSSLASSAFSRAFPESNGPSMSDQALANTCAWDMMLSTEMVFSADMKVPPWRNAKLSR
ncbi:hypothetical protein D9M71_669600 [compost metagenome]